MHYKLLGFSQKNCLRTFWFHRIGALGSTPVSFRVLADTSSARQHAVPLQELPSLCTRLLHATDETTPAGAALVIGEGDLEMYAAELKTPKPNR